MKGMAMPKTFSSKEAIAHGFRMTKKHLKLVFLVLLVYLAYGIADGVLTAGAGESRMRKTDVRELYEDPMTADRFYQHLQATGYVSNFGTRQAKLEDLKSAAELVLPPEFEGDRERIFEFLLPYTYRLPYPKAVYYAFAIGLWLVSILIGIGVIKMSILASRDQDPKFEELFAHGRLMLPYLLGSIAYGLAVLGGLFLLIIPGIIFMVMLALYPYFIIDKNMGPIQSLKASRSLTKGVRFKLLGFWALLMLVNLGGVLCLIIGLVFTLPATYIASAYVYDQLLSSEEAVPAAVV